MAYPSSPPRKKRSSSPSSSPPSPNWSALHTDLICSIIKRLSFVDTLRFRAVCPSWLSAAKSHASSSPPPPPMLMHPAYLLEEEDSDGMNNNLSTFHKRSAYDYRNSCFFSLSDGKSYNPLSKSNDSNSNSESNLLGKSPCVGSSHGWLILWDENPYIHNPFRRVSIPLPPMLSFPRFTGNFLHSNESGDLQVEYTIPSIFKTLSHPPGWLPMAYLKSNWIDKAILSSDPSRNTTSSSTFVVVVYNFNKRLAFCKMGDCKWTDLQVAGKSYTDIIWYRDRLYALSRDFSVEIWEFNNNLPVPVKKMEIKPTFSDNKAEEELKELSRDVYILQYYIVESLGEILLVVRYVGRCVREEDRVLVPKKDYSLYDCMYMTLTFRVFKLDFARTVWEEMESLGDRVLFLGGNHSASLAAAGQEFPKCHQNSIYFTDDNWLGMNSSDWKGGHDMGIFNMEDKCIKKVYETQLVHIQPPPFWAVPSPW